MSCITVIKAQLFFKCAGKVIVMPLGTVQVKVAGSAYCSFNGFLAPLYGRCYCHLDVSIRVEVTL